MGQVTGSATPAAPRTQPVGACPLCGASGARHLFAASDRLHATPGRFTYRRCRVCRTVFQDPMVIPEDLGLCYPDEYYTHLSPWGNDRRASTPIRAASDPPPAAYSLRRLRSGLGRSVRAAVRHESPSGFRGWLGSGLSRSRSLRQRAFAPYLDRRMKERGVRYYGSMVEELFTHLPGSLRALDIGCGSGRGRSPQLLGTSRVAG